MEFLFRIMQQKYTKSIIIGLLRRFIQNLRFFIFQPDDVLRFMPLKEFQ